MNRFLLLLLCLQRLAHSHGQMERREVQTISDSPFLAGGSWREKKSDDSPVPDWTWKWPMLRACTRGTSTGTHSPDEIASLISETNSTIKFNRVGMVIAKAERACCVDGLSRLSFEVCEFLILEARTNGLIESYGNVEMSFLSIAHERREFCHIGPLCECFGDAVVRLSSSVFISLLYENDKQSGGSFVSGGSGLLECVRDCLFKNVTRREKDSEVEKRAGERSFERCVVERSRMASVGNSFYSGIVHGLCGCLAFHSLNTSYASSASAWRNEPSGRQELNLPGDYSFSDNEFENLATPSLENGLYNDNTYCGAAIAFTDRSESSLTVLTCQFSNCTSGSCGGAIRARAISEFIVINSSFTNCSSRWTYGGAIYTARNAHCVLLSGLSFFFCQCQYSGGAVYISDFVPTDAACEFIPPSNQEEKTLISDTSFCLCEGQGAGGGAYVANMALLPYVRNSVFACCTSKGSGGGLHIIVNHTSLSGGENERLFFSCLFAASNSGSRGNDVFFQDLFFTVTDGNPFEDCQSTSKKNSVIHYNYTYTDHSEDWMRIIPNVRSVANGGSDKDYLCGFTEWSRDPCQTIGFAFSVGTTQGELSVNVAEEVFDGEKCVVEVGVGCEVELKGAEVKLEEGDLCGEERWRGKGSWVVTRKLLKSTEEKSLFVIGGSLNVKWMAFEHGGNDGEPEEEAVSEFCLFTLKAVNSTLGVKDCWIVSGCGNDDVTGGELSRSVVELSGGSVSMENVAVQRVRLGAGRSVIECINEDASCSVWLLNSTFVEIGRNGREGSVVCARSAKECQVECRKCVMTKCGGAVEKRGSGMEIGVCGLKGTVRLNECEFKECVVNEKEGRGGGLYLELGSGNAEFDLKSLTFERNVAHVGKDVYVMCVDLSELVNQSSFGFALGYINEENSMWGSDEKHFSSGERVEDVFFFLRVYEEKEVAVSESGRDTGYCGNEMFPCGTLEMGREHVVVGGGEGEEEEGKIVVNGRVQIDEGINMSGIVLTSASEEVKGVVEVGNGVRGVGGGVLVNGGMGRMSTMCVVLRESGEGERMVSGVVVSRGDEMRVMKCSFLSVEGGVWCSFVVCERGKVVVEELSFVNEESIPVSEGVSLFGVWEDGSMEFVSVDVERVKFARGSLLKVARNEGEKRNGRRSPSSGEWAMEEERKERQQNGGVAVVEMRGCVLYGVVCEAGIPSVMSAGNECGVELQMDGLNVTECVSSNSEEGGCVWFGVGGESKIRVVKTVMSQCAASAVGVTQEGIGRGGVFFLQYIGANETEQLAMRFEETVFVQNKATVGRDLYVSCLNLEKQVVVSQFSMDLRPQSFNRSNAFFGCGTVEGGCDVDLLDFMELYQSDVIVVSSVAEGSSDSKLCGSVDRPCSSLAAGLNHLVWGIETRVYIAGEVDVDRCVTLKDLSVKSMDLEEKAALAVGEMVEREEEDGEGRDGSGLDSGVNGVTVCRGRVWIERIQFMLPEKMKSVHDGLVCVCGNVSVMECVFGKEWKSREEETMIGMELPLIAVESGNVEVRQSLVSSLSFSVRGCFVKTRVDCVCLLGDCNVENVRFDGMPLVGGEEKGKKLSVIRTVFDSVVAEESKSQNQQYSGCIVGGEYEDVGMNEVNVTRCEAWKEVGSVMSIRSAKSVTLRNCLFSGSSTANTEGGQAQMCVWSGSLVDVVESTATLELVTMCNSSKGALSVEGGEVTIIEGKFEGNDPAFEKYPSFRRNILCSSSSSLLSSSSSSFPSVSLIQNAQEECVLNVSSLKGGDGWKDNTSLWIHPTTSCRLSGIPAERESAFFIPTVNNISTNEAGQRLQITLKGTLLLPCGTEVWMVVRDGEGAEHSGVKMQVEEHADEETVMAVVERAAVDAVAEENTVGVAVVFGIGEGGGGEGKRTELIVMRDGMKGKGEAEVRMAMGGNEKVSWLIVVVIVLGVMVVVSTGLAILSFVRGRKKERKEEKLFVKDVEMEASDEEKPTKKKREGEEKCVLMLEGEGERSTDQLLCVKDETMLVCNEKERDSDRHDTDSAQPEKVELKNTEQKKKQEEATKTALLRTEPIQTASSIDHLVEGMCCESPYEKVIVDTRDSLFERLHHSKDPMERMLPMKDRETRACRTLFWVLNGLEHIVDDGKHLEIIRCLSSYCVMFGEEGVVCLGDPRSAVAAKKKEESRKGKRDGIDLKAEKEGPGEKVEEGWYENNRWKAPELLERGGETGDEKSIVFSVGMLLHEMLTGLVPFHEIDAITAGLKILNGERPSLRDIENKLLKDTLCRCLQRLGRDRPTMAELKGVLLSMLPEGSRELGKGDARGSSSDEGGTDAQGNGGMEGDEQDGKTCETPGQTKRGEQSVSQTVGRRTEHLAHAKRARKDNRVIIAMQTETHSVKTGHKTTRAQQNP